MNNKQKLRSTLIEASVPTPRHRLHPSNHQKMKSLNQAYLQLVALQYKGNNKTLYNRENSNATINGNMFNSKMGNFMNRWFTHGNLNHNVFGNKTAYLFTPLVYPDPLATGNKKHQFVLVPTMPLSKFEYRKLHEVLTAPAAAGGEFKIAKPSRRRRRVRHRPPPPPPLRQLDKIHTESLETKVVKKNMRYNGNMIPTSVILVLSKTDGSTSKASDFSVWSSSDANGNYYVSEVGFQRCDAECNQRGVGRARRTSRKRTWKWMTSPLALQE